MRSVVVKPPRPFTEKLRAAGYRVCWPGKTDFNGVPMDTLADSASPVELATTASRLGCASVAFTYNDPTVFMEYAIDVAQACRARECAP